MAEAAARQTQAASSSSSSASDDPDHPTSEQIIKMSAEEREKIMARNRGVPEEDLASLRDKTKWYVSNRGDDRVVLFDRDPRHPGGEVLLGGSSPRRAYLTRTVEQAIYNLLLVEVPEPLRIIKGEDGQEYQNRKYPQDITTDPAIVVAAQPGQPIPLGRALDPELWDEGARKQVAQRMAQMPRDIPVPQGTVLGSA